MFRKFNLKVFGWFNDYLRVRNEDAIFVKNNLFISQSCPCHFINPASHCFIIGNPKNLQGARSSEFRGEAAMQVF